MRVREKGRDRERETGKRDREGEIRNKIPHCPDNYRSLYCPTPTPFQILLTGQTLVMFALAAPSLITGNHPGYTSAPHCAGAHIHPANDAAS